MSAYSLRFSGRPTLRSPPRMFAMSGEGYTNITIVSEEKPLPPGRVTDTLMVVLERGANLYFSKIISTFSVKEVISYIDSF